MTTARNIIESAAKKIHILGRGQTLPNDEIQDGLEILNDILGSVSAESDMIFTEAQDTFNLTTSGVYTVGSGQDFNTVRPWIINQVYVSQGTSDYNLKPYSQENFNAIGDKDITGIPEYYYYDNNHPVSRIYLWPKPIAGYTITISNLKPLTEFASIDTDYNMPAVYSKWLKNQLAIEWAPNFEKEASMTVQREAIKAKKNIVKYNTANNEYIMSVDSALLSRGRYDIRTGRY